jgi:hypothetical protein
MTGFNLKKYIQGEWYIQEQVSSSTVLVTAALCRKGRQSTAGAQSLQLLLFTAHTAV